MEKPNFDTQEYRDNLAKDLKDIRETDTEMAQKVLSEEQATTRYELAKEGHQNEVADRKANPVEYAKEDLEALINTTKYKIYGNSSEVEEGSLNKAEAENKVREDLFKDLILGKRNLVDASLGNHTSSHRHFIVDLKVLMETLNYSPSEEVIKELFSSIISGEGDAVFKAVTFFNDMKSLTSKEIKLPLSKEEAGKLFKTLGRGSIKWNGEKVSDITNVELYHPQDTAKYQEEKIPMVRKMIEDANEIYLTGASGDSYYNLSFEDGSTTSKEVAEN